MITRTIWVINGIRVISIKYRVVKIWASKGYCSIVVCLMRIDCCIECIYTWNTKNLVLSWNIMNHVWMLDVNSKMIMNGYTCNANIPIVVTIHWSGELAERDLQRQSPQLLFFILGGLPWFAYRSASPLYTILTVASLQSSQQNVWYTLLSPFGARVMLNTVKGKWMYTITDNICPFNYIPNKSNLYILCYLGALRELADYLLFHLFVLWDLLDRCLQCYSPFLICTYRSFTNCNRALHCNYYIELAQVMQKKRMSLT